MSTKRHILEDLIESIVPSKIDLSRYNDPRSQPSAKRLIESLLANEDTADHAHEVLDLINSMKSTHKWLTKQEAQKIGQPHLDQLKTELSNMMGQVDEMLEEFE